MQKKFFTNLILVLVLNALVKPFYILGIDAEILKQVEISSPGAYGEYFSLLGITFILNIFLDLGITNYNTKNIAQNSHLLKQHFSGLITLRALLTVAYMVLLFLTGYLLGYDQHQFKLLGILGVNQVLVSFILYFRSNLAGLLLFKQDSIVSVLDRLLLITICSILLWGGITDQAFKIEWFIYAQTFSYGVTALISAFLVIRRTGKLNLNLNASFSKKILKESLPYALLILLMMAYYKTDSVMIERMLPNGKEEAAVYARGYRFFEALNMIGYLFAGLLLPIFSRLLKQKEPVAELLYFSFKLILAFAVSMGLFSFFYQEEIMAWRFEIYGLELFQTARSFGVLMISFIFMSITYIFGTLLTANGNLKALNTAAGIGVVLNIVINYFLIPDLGAYGASLASLFTQVLISIVQVYLVIKLMKVNVSFRYILLLVSFSGGIILLAYYSQTITHHWTLKYLVGLVLSGSIAIISGMISIKGILSILKEKDA